MDVFNGLQNRKAGGTIAVVLWIVAGVAGCSGGPATGSVAGKVTLNGVPLTSGIVVFSDETAGVGASAELDQAGGYQIDALPLGDYQVAIQPPPLPPPHEIDTTAPGQSRAAPRYQTAGASGLTTTIKAGVNTADFAL